MVGIWQSYSDIYLYVAAAAMLLGFGLPLMIVPLDWARAFRWRVPEQTELVVFLARSMGIVISLMAIFAIQATRVPVAKPFFFDLMLCTFAAMLVLHVQGAIRRTQPVTETAEIGLWIVLLTVTLGFYPA